MPNAAPVANADSFSVHQGQLLTVAAVNGVLANDTDADTGYVGSDSFTYKVYDGTT